MTRQPLPRTLTVGDVVGEYFIENRNRLLEIAAFLDRVDRAAEGGAPPRDFRVDAFRSALAALAGDGRDRVAALQMLFSDPTTEPLPALDRKGALGAWDPDRSSR